MTERRARRAGTVPLFLACVLAACGAALPASADGSGPEFKVEDKEDGYKLEYKDRRCEFKYELKYDTGEEKVEEKGDCRRAPVPRPGGLSSR